MYNDLSQKKRNVNTALPVNVQMTFEHNEMANFKQISFKASGVCGYWIAKDLSCLMKNNFTSVNKLMLIDDLI